MNFIVFRASQFPKARGHGEVILGAGELPVNAETNNMEWPFACRSSVFKPIPFSWQSRLMVISNEQRVILFYFTCKSELFRL